MDLALVTGKAICKLLVMIAVGMIGCKAGVVSRRVTDVLADVLFKIICPILIITSYIQDYEPAKLVGLLEATGLALVTHIIAMIVAGVFVRKTGNPDWQVERFCVVYSNCGFMGIPVLYAIFGSEAVFYLSGYITVFNILVWSHGVLTMSGKASKEDVLAILKSPNILSVLVGILIYVTQLPTPDILVEPLKQIGSCNTPIAMIIAGSTIMQSRLSETLKNKRTYLICALRLMVAPAAFGILLKFIPVPELVGMTIFVAACCPIGTMAPIFAIKFQKNAGYASGLFAITTLLCMATIPLMILLYHMV